MAAAQLGIARVGFERVGEGVDVAGLDQHAGLAVARPGWSRRWRRAATTGSAQAIASSVTLPNASVIDGLSRTSALASARARSSPTCWPMKIASGRRCSNHGRAGPSPMTSTRCLTPRSASASIASANTSRPFSITSRPRKATTSSSSAMPSAAAPIHVAAAGIELLAVDAARPDRDVAVHALGAQHRGGRFGGRDDRVAAAVEAPHDRAHRRLEPLEMVISEIGLEAGVDRGDGRRCLRRRAQLTARWATMSGLAIWTMLGAKSARSRRTRAGQCAAAGDIRRGRGIGTDGTLTRSPVGSNAGFVDRRRIDADLRALAQQIADQPVERLVGAVADIIVIAREQGDAKVARLHRPALSGGAGKGNQRAMRASKIKSGCRRSPGATRGCSSSAACPATPRWPRSAIMRIRPTSSGGCSAGDRRGAAAARL